jgi:uncharacterized protein
VINLARTRLHRGGGLLIAVLAVFVFAVFATGGAALAAAPKFPALTGRVVDDAPMLSPATAQKLDGELADLEAKTGHQMVVATVPDLQGHEIEDYGYQLGRAWQVGRKGVNDGVILLVAPAEHKVRIEVGYGLEPVLTDALTSVILQSKVLPQFKAGHMEQGVVDGAEALIAQGLGGLWWLPFMFMGGGRNDRWGGAGGFGGGGGFSGGGGSFGGGGSSGSW